MTEISRPSRTGLPVVGMIGGGQLARMTHQAAISLGQSLRVLTGDRDESAALVAADVELGSHTDLAALRAFAKGCDVVTFDHEHVPAEHIRALAAEGVRIFPSAEAIRYTQDKRVMRERLSQLGFPVPRWAWLAEAGLADFGLPAIVKTVSGGYDGRGVFLVSSLEDELPETDLIVEELVPLRRELAVQVARSPFGQVAVYPVVQTVQRDGICVEVLAPAPDLPEPVAAQAQQIAIRIAIELGVVGLLAVELFEVDGGGLLVNELAMRPHNSGHWTIEGARTSQFEQHLRAVLDYPMGETHLTAPAVAMANVLGGPPGGMSIDERLHHMMAAEPGVKVHLYGKQIRPGRKIGHVTALGEDMADCRARASRAAAWLQLGEAS
ncbi:MAG TPA: 5-(carboxyamino)imidazole ribonucleotide synthase [Candidatus Limnocylindrales bacterium]|nr:5-(carboxyamino)imidazole ribonucleotide synthase [Candidatus Limnocylindrales bacterium]